MSNKKTHLLSKNIFYVLIFIFSLEYERHINNNVLIFYYFLKNILCILIFIFSLEYEKHINNNVLIFLLPFISL